MRENSTSGELENSIASELIHVSRRLLQRGSQVMEDLNIGVGQVPIMRLLSLNGTMTQRQLADEIRVTPATICGTLKRMERAGLIVRAAAAEDARVSRVSLTEEGEIRCSKAQEALRCSYREMLQGFTEAERGQMAEFIRRMGENLSRTTKDEGRTSND